MLMTLFYRWAIKQGFLKGPSVKCRVYWQCDDVPVLIVPGFGQKSVSVIWSAPKYLSDSSQEKVLIRESVSLITEGFLLLNLITIVTGGDFQHNWLPAFFP